jgi:zinc transport system substrate-binding protein
VDPAFWSPEPETIASYQAADLILLNGADYAKWVAQASLPTTRLVDTGSAYADRLIPLEEAVTHAHGPEGEHAHGGLAFTTWLDPTLALEQARAIAAAFEKARPEQAAEYGARLASLEADLTALDERLEAVAATIGDRPLLFSHPVYQYLERRYDLNGRSVHWEPDAEPSEKQWRELQRLLDEHPARWMVWESEPLDAVAARLEERGVASVVFEPCGHVPAESDYLSVMRSNLGRFESAWPAAGGA